MRAIRHGNPEKHGNAVDSGHAESCHGCGTALNCVPAHAAGVTSRAMAQAHPRCAVQCCRSVSNNPAPRAACGSAAAFVRAPFRIFSACFSAVRSRTVADASCSQARVRCGCDCDPHRNSSPACNAPTRCSSARDCP